MKIFGRFVSIALFTGIVALAQAQQSRISVEEKEGFGCFPGGLFTLDPSIEKHPPHLCGFTTSPTVAFRLSPSYFIGVDLQISELFGKGPWMRRNPQATANGVVGVANGSTHMSMSGAAITLTKEFFPKGKFQLRTEGGAGPGRVGLGFHGTFAGTQNGDPFTMPVTDHVARMIPLIVGGAEIVHKTKTGMSEFGVGYKWDMANIGYGSFTIDPVAALGRMFGR